RRDIWCRRARRNYPLTERRPTCIDRKEVSHRQQSQRLTTIGIPIKLEESNRGCPDPRESAAIPFCSSPLGGRPIGRTPDSGSGYPGSSPGLPAKMLSPVRPKGYAACGDARSSEVVSITYSAATSGG